MGLSQLLKGTSMEEPIEGGSLNRSRRYLYLTVFFSGMTTLAIEFTASRMLQTVYGTSNVVWANVIGLVLLFLTLGYFIGGRVADRHPQFGLFYTLVALAGFSSVFFLIAMSLLLHGSAAALAAVDVGSLLGSLLGVFVTLAVPVTLLGCVSPFAIRLGVRDVSEAGRISGRIYAVSTWGSLLGTYLPVLFVIPLAGTRVAAIAFGLLLLVVGLIGLWRVRAKSAIAGAGLSLLLVPMISVGLKGNIKDSPGQIYETESAYNYIQIVRHEDCNFLLLNEGQAYHSYYCDGGRVPRISVWSIMLAARYFNAGVDEPAVESLAVVGLAAGTIAKQYTQSFGPIHIDGIELDPVIITVASEYFDLNEPNIRTIVGDGRYELNRLVRKYDVIALDAYKVPYIPWHLTTREFYGEVRERLSGDGVLAVNVGWVPGDRRLVESVTATLLEVFPTVHTVDVPGSLNSILVATVLPTRAQNIAANLAAMDAEERPLVYAAVRTAADNLRPTVAAGPVFTDERAPVEPIVDSLVIRYLVREGPSGLPLLGE
jgi:spermidine synthase